jgi:HK97 family phage portal protein
MEFNFFKKKKREENIEERGGFYEALLYSTATNYTQNKAMLLSAVYRCVDVISDAVAQLPLEPYFIDKQGYKTKFTKHPTYNLLNYEPNHLMSRFTFIKSLVVSVLLKGNGYAFIERDGSGNVKSINFVEADLVTPIFENGKLSYSITGKDSLVESINMIHILNFSYNGIIGVSTLQHARLTLGLASDSESHASGFFKGGANLAGILKVEGSLSSKQKADLKSS